MLLAPVYLNVDLALLQLLLQRLRHVADHFAPVAARGLDGLGEHAVTVRIEMLEGEVLELLVDRVQPQAVRDGRVDLERLARDAAALGRLDRVERAHVVQAVRELDQDDAHVARHREQHLAEILGLRFFLGLELDLVELRDAVDQLGDALAEVARDLGLGDRGVLRHVVQQRRSQRLRVHVPLREDVGDRERVGDVGLAGLAVLPFVRRLTEIVRRFELRNVLRLQIAGPFLENRRGCGHGGRGMRDEG